MAEPGTAPSPMEHDVRVRGLWGAQARHPVSSLPAAGGHQPVGCCGSTHGGEAPTAPPPSMAPRPLSEGFIFLAAILPYSWVL